MKWSGISRVAIAAIFVSLPSFAQDTSSINGPNCPIVLLRINPAAVSVHVKNASGKVIVGLVFKVALSDATEHWKWLHWDFDDGKPLREFGWNKRITANSSKTLTWPAANLDFEHVGGGAFVLTSVLYEDSSDWNATVDNSDCKILWLKHKKSFTRDVRLPPREEQSGQ
jgi:hypothetical protein